MRKKAFTLVEILVVISVISVLMAILMPVLTMARIQSKSIACLGNLQQMSIAAIIYTNSNDGFFPMANVTELSGSAYKMCAWDFTTIYDHKGTFVEPGLLWQGETIEKIHQCPSFKGSANWAIDPYTGYNYNTSYIGGQGAMKDGYMLSHTVTMSSRISEIRKPDRCAVFGDGQWENGANKFMRSPFPGKLDKYFSGRYAGTQGYRHAGKTNVAWADGSASSAGDCFTESHAGEKANIAAGTGFLSPDNSIYDLK